MKESGGNTSDIAWRAHFTSTAEQVYEALATDSWRERYWAEEVTEENGVVRFVFLNGIESSGRVLAAEPPHRYALEYFGNPVTFEITRTDDGCDLNVLCAHVTDENHPEVYAGWVSWLLTMRAAVDFDVDLRNHHPERTWHHGFADN